MIQLSAKICIPPSNVAGTQMNDNGSITVFFCHKLGDVKQMTVSGEYVGCVLDWEREQALQRKAA